MSSYPLHLVFRRFASQATCAALLLLPLALGFAPAASAQTARPPYKVGDRVEADPMGLNQWRPATVI